MVHFTAGFNYIVSLCLQASGHTFQVPKCTVGDHQRDSEVCAGDDEQQGLGISQLICGPHCRTTLHNFLQADHH